MKVNVNAYIPDMGGLALHSYPAGRAACPADWAGHAAVITGVSRPAAIGYAIARRLAALGASLYLHHYVPHDRDQPHGEDPGRLIQAAAEACGHLDILVCNHARSGDDGPLGTLDAARPA
jgi:3-oxoacyl-[acyl-carrier protein] reductase